MEQPAERTIGDLVFVGFNRWVLALERHSGEIVWEWKSPKGSGAVSLLLDGDRLIVSVSGFMYCLDPLYGQLAWKNPLTGKGMGVTCLTSLRGLPGTDHVLMAQVAQQAQAAAATASATAP